MSNSIPADIIRSSITLSLSCIIAASLVALSLVLSFDTDVMAFISVALGATGLVLLAMAAKKNPLRALTLWGGAFLPMSGIWVAPAFVTSLESVTVLLGLAGCGILFYGGSAWVLSLALQGSLTRWRFLILPLAVPLAEYLAMYTGLVMAPVGLVAVAGGWAWGLTIFGAVASGGILLCWVRPNKGT